MVLLRVGVAGAIASFVAALGCVGRSRLETSHTGEGRSVQILDGGVSTPATPTTPIRTGRTRPSDTVEEPPVDAGATPAQAECVPPDCDPSTCTALDGEGQCDGDAGVEARADTDDCLGNPCDAAGDSSATCVHAPLSNGYSCDCSVGYVFDGSSCAEFDACAANDNPCNDAADLDAACVDAAPPSDGYSCRCSAGFTQIDGLCIDENACQGNPCGGHGDTNAICHDDAPPSLGYACSCGAGYAFDGTSCAEFDACTANDNPCNDAADLGAACVDAAPPSTGYSCSCSAGYTEIDGLCVDQDGCHDKPCNELGDAAAICHDDAPPSLGYACTCGAGYVFDGTSCAEFDACTANDNPCNDAADLGAACVDAPPPSTGYSCSCSAGYTEIDGLCVDENACQGNPCDGHGDTAAICHDDAPPSLGYACSCGAGFVFDGTSCAEFDACTANDNPCNDDADLDAACVDAPPPSTGYSCSCSAGFAEIDGLCVDRDGCHDKPCNELGDAAAICHDDAPPSLGYACTCGAGYIFDGTSCAEFDACTANDNPCNDGADLDAACVDAPPPSTGYSCSCSAGFAEIDGLCVDVDECQGNPCDDYGDTAATCQDNAPPLDGYTCSCSAEYAGTGTACLGVSEELCRPRFYECGLFEESATGMVNCGQCANASDACVSNRCEARCRSSQVEGTSDGIIAHVMNQVSDEDVSDNRVAVEVRQTELPDWRAEQWRSRIELQDKSLSLMLADVVDSGPFTVSVRLLPTEQNQDAVLFSSGALEVRQVGDAIQIADGVQATTATAASLRQYDCNHVAVVFDGANLTAVVNGEIDHTSTIRRSSLGGLDGVLQVGPFPGKVWDVRVYGRALSEVEVDGTAGLCLEARIGDTLYTDETEGALSYYQCGAYMCHFYPPAAVGTEAGERPVTHDEINYNLVRHDEMRERNTLVAGMYPQGQLCEYLFEHESVDGYPSWRPAKWNAGLRSFVVGRDFDTPANQYWLHENFHSYQGPLARFPVSPSINGPKWVDEGQASWGADFNRPGVEDDLMGAYTLQPHMPLYANQSAPSPFSPADVPSAGAHQYGSSIFMRWLSEVTSSAAYMGVWMNHGSATRDFMKSLFTIFDEAGHDIQDVFIDFAAHTITWDYESHAADYANNEQVTLRRMLRQNDGSGGTDCSADARCDARFAVSYDAQGTGPVWVDAPQKFLPGNWAYNAYEVSLSTSATYSVGLTIDASNPADAEYRAMVVLYDENTGERSYHSLEVAPHGVSSNIELDTGSATKLYLVVAAVPMTWDDNWAVHPYQYQIAPVPVAQVFILAGQSNMLGSNSKRDRLETYLCSLGASSGVGCGDTTIADDELTEEFFLDVESAISRGWPVSEVTDRLENFLCKAGRVAGAGCGLRDFDATDRLFRHVVNHYFDANAGVFKWGVDFNRQMTTSIDLVEANGEGLFDEDLLTPRANASVLMFLASRVGNSRTYAESSGPLTIGFGADGNNVYGPELAFGHSVANQLSDEVILIKVVQGGTSLRVDWRSPSVEANTDNLYSDEELQIESLYPKLLEVGRGLDDQGWREQHLPSAVGKHLNLAGFVWFQGWNDGGDPAESEYEDNFRGFVSDLRSDLGHPDLPIAVAISHRGEPTEPIQTGQAHVCAETSFMECGVTDDLSNYFHFDSAAYLSIGHRLGHAMSAALPTQ